MCESFPAGREEKCTYAPPRSITRANAKKGKQEDKLTMRSIYGHMDPTPYLAIRHMEQTERQSQKKTA